MAEKPSTPNRDKWFKRNSHRGLEVERPREPHERPAESTVDTSNAGTAALDAQNTPTKYANDGPLDVTPPRTPTPTTASSTPTTPRPPNSPS